MSYPRKPQLPLTHQTICLFYLAMMAITRKEIEARARELGVKQKAIEKWRLRGIPPKWQLKLMSAYSDIKLEHLTQ